jgi:hypothetical protein
MNATRLLQAYVEARASSRFLHLAFNKDLQEIKHAEFVAAGATNINVKTAQTEYGHAGSVSLIKEANTPT